ncbi:MAG: tol-pal system YbgF family protein [Rhodothermales bacterium]
MDRVEEQRDRIIIDLTVQGGRNSGAAFMISNEMNNGVSVHRSINLRTLTELLRRWDVTSLSRQKGRESVLFFEQIRRQRIVFVSVQQGASNRYRIALYPASKLNLDTLYKEGEAAYASGRREEAIRYWEFVLSEYGLHREALVRMAGVHFDAGRYAEAEERYGKIIDLDERNWQFPEARVRFALARDLQGKELSKKHQMCLDDYIRYGKGQYMHEARQLLKQAKKPVAMKPLTSSVSRSVLRKLARSKHAVVYFWSPEVRRHWDELSQLFAFSLAHRDVDFYVVAVDDGNRLRSHEAALSKLYAPYWPDERQLANNEGNVVFLVDEEGFLPRELLPADKRSNWSNTKTLFLEKKMVARFQEGAFNWKQLQLSRIWNMR